MTGKVIVVRMLALVALGGLLLVGRPADARCVLKYEKETPGKRTAQAIKRQRAEVDRRQKEALDALRSHTRPNEVMSREADYVQALLDLYRAMSGGVFPASLPELQCAYLVKEFPKSPYANEPIRPRGIGDKLFPGDIVYVPEQNTEGKLRGYWLIPIGKTDQEPEPPMTPLPGGLKVPKGALFVLEFHIEGPMTKL